MHRLVIVGGVLRRPQYAMLAVFVSAFVFSVAVWLPNVRLIGTVLQSSISAPEKIAFLGALYGSIETNFTVISATYTILVSVLLGVLIALLTYYIAALRANADGWRGAGSAGLGGMISGALGIGCAACGTFVLTSMLAVFGAGGLAALLPFAGAEFGFLGVALLLYAIFIVVKRIDSPRTCPA